MNLLGFALSFFLSQALQNGDGGSMTFLPLDGGGQPHIPNDLTKAGSVVDFDGEKDSGTSSYDTQSEDQNLQALHQRWESLAPLLATLGASLTLLALLGGLMAYYLYYRRPRHGHHLTPPTQQLEEGQGQGEAFVNPMVTSLQQQVGSHTRSSFSRVITDTTDKAKTYIALPCVAGEM